MAEETGPLKAADLVELTAQLARLQTAELEIERAERAGIDLADQKTRVRDLRTQLSKIKQAYFPGQ